MFVSRGEYFSSDVFNVSINILSPIIDSLDENYKGEYMELDMRNCDEDSFRFTLDWLETFENNPYIIEASIQKDLQNLFEDSKDFGKKPSDNYQDNSAYLKNLKLLEIGYDEMNREFPISYEELDLNLDNKEVLMMFFAIKFVYFYTHQNDVYVGYKYDDTLKSLFYNYFIHVDKKIMLFFKNLIPEMVENNIFIKASFHSESKIFAEKLHRTYKIDDWI
jgi:hypothetical protein